MPSDLLPFPAAVRPSPATAPPEPYPALYPAPAEPRAPDLAYSALVLLTRLRDSLAAAARLLAACRKAERKANPPARRGSVPPLFYFDRRLQADLDRARERAPRFPEPYLQQLSSKFPAEALAYRRLPDLVADARTLLGRVEVRRAARTLAGLAEALAATAADVRGAGEIAEYLAIPDDQVVLAVHPAARVGVRVLMTGIADLNQLHLLLADAFAGDAGRGLPPARRPDPRAVAACRDADPDPAAATVTGRFQLYRPAALRRDGTLPEPFRGTEHWCFGDDSPNTLPREQGERVLLLGEPPVPPRWAVGRKFARVAGGLEVVQRLDRIDVTRWLLARCPDLPRSAVLAPPLARAA